jgi:hypothetical protein
MKRSAWVVVALLGSIAPARAESVEPEPEPAAGPPEPAEPAEPAEPEPPPPPPPRTPTPFDRGKFSLGGGAGRQSNLGFDYFVIGLGVGYYVLDGVEVGLAGLYQFGDGPSISQLSPSLRYVAQPLVGRSPLIPYGGVFYRHWFIGSDIDDVDTLGGRVGLLYVSGFVIGLGIVYEHTVSECVEDCGQFYPDFTISLSF